MVRFAGRTACRLGSLLLVLAALAGAPALAADETLMEAQNILQMLGLNPGKANGEMQPRTAHALGEFQRANGLPSSGKLDDATMTQLRKKRDTQFSGSFGTPKPGASEPRKPMVEPKPQAQPVDPVNAAPLEAAPGTRTLSPTTTLSGASVSPPALFGNAPPAAAPGGPANPVFPTGAAPADAAPLFGLASWNWIFPFLGIPLFAFLWWLGMHLQRRQSGSVEPGLKRREPSLDEAPATPGGGGRREPRL